MEKHRRLDMNSYLIDYHRPTGKVTCTHYPSSTEATGKPGQ